MADGFVAVAAKINLDGGVGVVLFTSEGFERMLGEFHGDGRRGQRQRIRDHLGNDQRDAGVQIASHGPGGCERRGGLGEIGEDDLEVEPAIGKAGFRGRRAVFEANGFLVHQFQDRDASLKAASRSAPEVLRKC